MVCIKEICHLLSEAITIKFKMLLQKTIPYLSFHVFMVLSLRFVTCILGEIPPVLVSDLSGLSCVLVKAELCEWMKSMAVNQVSLSPLCQYL